MSRRGVRRYGDILVVPATIDDLEAISDLNKAVFAEDRIINTFDRDDLLMYMAVAEESLAGFKIGYRESYDTFYSAKGAVHPAFRRRGIARHLLHAMVEDLKAKGFQWFAYDTFPNKHPGMTILGLQEGFRVTRADFNDVYRDYRLRFEKRIG
jgi:GNAT superfamily N-acetyltransferase